ncbi:MAG: menaquinone biosynthesis family protein [Phycisphaerales bacterium JB065]
MPNNDSVELTIGHSPDPDDAFMWWPLGTAGLEGGPADAPVLEPVLETGRFRFRPVAADIEQLNRRALDAGDLDITAMSMHAYAHARDRYMLTDCGGSFGEGYGPKVLVTESVAREAALAGQEIGIDWLRAMLDAGGVIAVPGTKTSAFLVLNMLLSGGDAAKVLPAERYRAMRFDTVVPAILSGEVQAGLVIHEAQVTYAEEGLAKVVDLGVWWGEETGGLPLPLGANAIRSDLDERYGPGTREEVARLLRASIEYAAANRKQGLDYAMRFATNEARTGGDGKGGLVDHFIELYVNELTMDFGERGQRAIERLLQGGAALGLAPQPRAGRPAVEVVRSADRESCSG